MYKVVLLPKAEKAFARAESPLARKLAAAFKLLETDPLRHANIKPLTGPLKGFLRFRAGDYRLVYRVDPEEATVYVVRIAHRKEAYQ
jgi:mRNA interferase RelE/StbE